MSAKFLVPLFVAGAILAGCGHRDDAGTATEPDKQPATEPAAATPGAGDTATTPGGNAGDPSTTPPSTTSSPDAAPSETPPPGGG